MKLFDKFLGNGKKEKNPAGNTKVIIPDHQKKKLAIQAKEQEIVHKQENVREKLRKDHEKRAVFTHCNPQPGRSGDPIYAGRTHPLRYSRSATGDRGFLYQAR